MKNKQKKQSLRTTLTKCEHLAFGVQLVNVVNVSWNVRRLTDTSIKLFFSINTTNKSGYGEYISDLLDRTVETFSKLNASPKIVVYDNQNDALHTGKHYPQTVQKIPEALTFPDGAAALQFASDKNKKCLKIQNFPCVIISDSDNARQIGSMMPFGKL